MKTLTISVAGYILSLNFAYVCHVACQSLQSSTRNSVNLTVISPQSNDGNISWVKIATLNPSETLRSTCVNCTKAEFEELTDTEHQRQQKMRKRRRNRKPQRMRGELRRMPDDHVTHKKHSTRVRLDKPVRFLHSNAVKENSVDSEVPLKSVRHEATTVRVENDGKHPPPVRYLLPPFMDKYFPGNTVAVDKFHRKPERPTERTEEKMRGSTKFKNTMYYKEDPGINEIVNFVSSTEKAESRQEATSHKLNFKPIVVEPVLGLGVQNVSSRSDTDMVSLVSGEVANAKMGMTDMSSMRYETVTKTSRPEMIFGHQMESTVNNNQDSMAQRHQQLLSSTYEVTQSRLSAATPKSYSNEMLHVAHTSNPTRIYSDTQMSYSIGNLSHSDHALADHPKEASRPQVLDQFPAPAPRESFYTFIEPRPHFPASQDITISRPMNYDLTARQQHQRPKEPGYELLPPLLPPLLPLPSANFDNSLQLFSTSPQEFETSSQSTLPVDSYQLQPERQYFAQSATVKSMNYENQVSVQEQRQAIDQSGPRGLDRESSQTDGHDMRRPQTGNYYFTTERSTQPVTLSTEMTRNVTRNSKKQSNGKGLELAESQYFADLPSEQEIAQLFQNGEVIPGSAGRDYPIFGQHLLQKRRFACRGLEGYFADVSTRCQVFYICNGNGAGEPMLCPNGTLFSQELLVCDWWYNVDC